MNTNFLLPLALLCACASEPNPKMRELERTHLFSGKEISVHRILDVDLGVVCYTTGSALSCLQVSAIAEEEE